MTWPPQTLYPDSPPETLVVLFRIITRESWRELQDWHEALPGSSIELIEHGIFALVIAPGGASWPTAKTKGGDYVG